MADESRELSDVELLDVSIERACRAKHDAGRRKYGAAWRWEHPIVELHGELIDALVYLWEGRLWGTVPEGVFHRMNFDLTNLILGVRTLARGLTPEELASPAPRSRT